MNTEERSGIDGQEALRVSLLKELTNSVDHKSLLKEHYDWLQELTSISKKTLRRFFRERVKVGPHTRNLLAAIALGRKEELSDFQEEQKDYYLLFLESIQSTPTDVHRNIEPAQPKDEIRDMLAQKYGTFNTAGLSNETVEYQILMGVRKRITTDNDRFFLSEQDRSTQQEVPLIESLFLNHVKPVLLGGAGMGKTTLAQNFCREWSEHRENSVPVYIDLKSDSYRTGENSVMEYLLGNYFGQQRDWAVTEFLERRTEAYYLILDGFDALLANEKIDLIEEVHAFSPNVRYLILSRSYGFGDFGYPSRSVYEIRGLAPEGKRKLLQSYRDYHFPDIDLAPLLDYLKKHSVLSEISRCPMSLMRIARLVKVEMLYELLDDVESSLDLQHLFINYVADSIKN